MSTGLGVNIAAASETDDVLAHEDRLLDAAGESFELRPQSALKNQLTRLALASALEARLLNTSNDRLQAFNLSANPDQVSLRQLAALHRPHRGTAGQAFELAVADACNSGVPEVAGAFREAFRLLGYVDGGEPRVTVLGLEKVPADRASEVADHLRRQLPQNGVLHTGLRGRPASVETVVRRMTEASWIDIQRATGESIRASQLPRADALVAIGSRMVAASFKIRPTAIYRPGWSGVPIWVSLMPGSSTSVSIVERADYPTVAIYLGQSYWLTSFYDALDVLDRALTGIDLRPRAVAAASPLTRQLRLMRNEPISEVAAKLRAVHPDIRSLAFSDTSVAIAPFTAPVAEASALHAGWGNASANGELFMGQRHLFLDPQTRDLSRRRETRVQHRRLES